MVEKVISSDLIRGHIDTIILHTLLDGDKYAQQISETVENKSDKQYGINQATLYSSLKRLENAKYVNAYWHDSEEGRRRFFKLTESGKKLIETNLSDWSFSRAIIDKLIDFKCAETESSENVAPKIVTIYQPLPQTQEQTTQSQPLSNPEPQKASPIPNKSILQPFSFVFNKPTENSPSQSTENKKLDIENNKESLESDKEFQQQSIQEINYKNILHGLIKATESKQVRAENEVLTPLNIENTDCKTEKTSFNESLNLSVDMDRKTSYDGKIDFSDVIEKADQEGYTVRISSKGRKQGAVKGSVYLNRVRLVSSLAIFLLTILEFLFFSLQFKSEMPASALSVTLSIIILAIFPVLMVVFYFKAPGRTSKPMKVDLIYTVAIIVFNLMLITFAGNILFGIDFSKTSTTLYSFIIPVTLYLDAICYFIFRYIFSRNANFRVKINA